MITPGPSARNVSSDRSAVTLFHWRYSVSHRAVPDDAVGEMDPNSISWRPHHGDDHEEVEREAPDGAADAEERRPMRAPRADALDDEDETDGAAEQEGVVPGERRHADQEPAQDECPTVSAEAARGEPQGGGDDRLEDGEVLGLGHEDGAGGRDRGEDAGAHLDRLRCPDVTSDRPREGRRERPDQHHRERRRDGRRAHDGDEWRLDEGREREPMGVGRDRQHRVRRDGPADLGEDPDEWDRQSLAGRERSSHVDVVVRVGVGRVRVHDHQYPTDHEGERV